METAPLLRGWNQANQVAWRHHLSSWWAPCLFDLLDQGFHSKQHMLTSSPWCLFTNYHPRLNWRHQDFRAGLLQLFLFAYAWKLNFFLVSFLQLTCSLVRSGWITYLTDLSIAVPPADQRWCRGPRGLAGPSPQTSPDLGGAATPWHPPANRATIWTPYPPRGSASTRAETPSSGGCAG